MKIRKAHIVVALAVLLVLLSCSRKHPRIIPPSTMSKIYADMVVADQWIRSGHNNYLRADTSLVYDPIFEKYGYTMEDYRASAGKYLRKPGEFADIFEDARSILQKQIVEMVALEKIEKQNDSVRINLERIIANMQKPELFDAVPLYDSIKVVIDSMDMISVLHTRIDSTDLKDEKNSSEIPVPAGE